MCRCSFANTVHTLAKEQTVCMFHIEDWAAFPNDPLTWYLAVLLMIIYLSNHPGASAMGAGVLVQVKTRLRPVPYFPDMSGWSSGPIFSGEVRFFPNIDCGMSGGDFVNYAEPTTHVSRYFYCHTDNKN